MIEIESARNQILSSQQILQSNLNYFKQLDNSQENQQQIPLSSNNDNLQVEIGGKRQLGTCNLSPTFFYSINEKPNFQRELKVLVANDCPFQLKMMETLLKKHDFDVKLVENGHDAFNQVRNFIENYNKVVSLLQKPGSIQNQFSSNDLIKIKQTLKNYDMIILDLNMPIMNGYDACEHICEVYNCFNSLPDYDDYVIGNHEQEKHLSHIRKLLNKIENHNSESEENLSINQDSIEITSQKSLSKMLKEVKDYYQFKTHFNGILRVKPLMVACSAEVNAQVLKQTKEVGFDKTVTCPLNQDIIKGLVAQIQNKYRAQNHFLKKQNPFNSMVVQGSLDSLQNFNQQQISSVALPNFQKIDQYSV